MMTLTLTVAAEAGSYGQMTRDAIRQGFSIETIYLFAKIAAGRANLAMKFYESSN
jgi:hypothetical protein